MQLRIDADASGVGYGGSITLSGDQKVPFVGTFSAQEAAQSSTEREMKGYEAAITTAVEKFPDQIHGTSALVKLGDNQGAISALNHLRSPVPGIHQSLCTKGFPTLQPEQLRRRGKMDATRKPGRSRRTFKTPGCI